MVASSDAHSLRVESSGAACPDAEEALQQNTISTSAGDSGFSQSAMSSQHDTGSQTVSKIAENIADVSIMDEDQDKGIVVYANDMVPVGLTKKKKKRKSKKPASKRGLGKPTGFEDNYADAPLTPEEFNELRELYHPDVPFVDRILRAIQRFERTRKLSPERRDVFYKYLAYGGIDVGPNMFQGQQDTEGMTKDDIVTSLAQTSIDESKKAEIYDPKALPPTVEESQTNTAGSNVPNNASTNASYSQHQRNYIVDFERTMCAFISRRAPAVFALDTKDQVDLLTTTLERFMDYLLQHDVCLEWSDEVFKTRDLCRQARIELWSCVEAQRCLPGDFNIACSTLFGGSYGKNYDGVTDWGPSQTGNTFVGLTAEKATQIVGFAIATTADDISYRKYAETAEQGGMFKVLKTIAGHGFQILSVDRAGKDSLKIYHANTEEYKPVGKIQAKLWTNPDAPPEDLTEEEQDTRKPLKSPQSDRQGHDSSASNETLTFFLEDSTILPHLRPGQAIECTMHLLDCGIWFFDEFISLYPSFDVWIENEMMLGWKGPKPLKGSLDYVEDIYEGGGAESDADAADAAEPVEPADDQIKD